MFSSRSLPPAALLLGAILAGCGRESAPALDAAQCAPNRAPIQLTGSIASADAKTYQVHPFSVAPGPGRIELSYQWTEKSGPPSTELTTSTMDLGLWDEKGYRNAAGFRGWSGSRQGRIDQKQAPVFVQADSAERGYIPGKIQPGVWYAELGVGAVSPQGADWLLKIECKAGGGATPKDDPVDATHVARSGPGWYHGDLHMHAYHSNPKAPTWDQFVAMARAARLDFLMVTEYVTGEHWRTLGAVQRANPDLVIWPGREIITYFGHVMTHGETPGLMEYRHGFEDVTITQIQKAARTYPGVLFQVNHPTSFPGPVFANFCRGCEYTLGSQTDWDQVDTIEILNGPVIVTGDDIGAPIPGSTENPFMTTALKLWQDLLMQGHKITGVSGSDSKGVEPDDAERIRRGYGSSATAVYARELSRDGIREGLKAGHAYVRTRGVDRSPALEFEASAPDGTHAIFGDTLKVGATDVVTLKTTVTGGMGQVLRYVADGVNSVEVPITADPFVHELPVTRLPDEGPLGTFWRVETLDSQTRTTLGNPIFLKGGS